ncbi:acyltransferase-domain-containing protein [Dendryphion nanum]|uniref:Acyltransferase-domain-containing protein n=1 Tax=Dendryphion nanum TaxID=256645 RepID=A0A9P9IBH3_9PLEO|nr:acyltransferase-domain-containing protein [Dendryphion nanum]
MSPAIDKKNNDLGAGLRVSKQNVEPHPAGPPRHGQLSQAERAFTLASTFLSGVLAISASQFLGAPLKLIDPVFYEGYMAYTKECFAILITCLTQWWAPTVVRVSGDASMMGQLVKKKDGSLQCNFADRMVLMANHQLYTDWLYLWWIAYTNNMHGFIYIILKESLKNIPIIGWGAQFYNFIFLARNWEEDQRRFKKHLSKLNKATDPMWLIIFPEGTNLSASTREKSKKWAEKNGLQDMKHQLLPRSTGLKFCLNELKDTTEWLYDCTIAYEGVPPGQFGQDIFTLRSSFFEGRPPKSVNMHWRRFHISTIPIGNTKAFEVWLRNRWREKDYMLEYFNRHTRFPADDFWKDHLEMSDRSSSSHKTLRTMPKPAIQIETEVKSGNWNEFVKIFAPITSVMMALTVAYGASPSDLIPGGNEVFAQHLKALLSGGGVTGIKGLPSPDELEKLIEGAAQMGAQQATQQPDVSKVQQLTQENLAKLVKETAIKNGIVMPGGMRRASTAMPAVTAPMHKPPASFRDAQRAKSAVNLNTNSNTKAPVKKIQNPTTTKTLSGTPKQPLKTTQSKTKPTPPKKCKPSQKLYPYLLFRSPKRRKRGLLRRQMGLCLGSGKKRLRRRRRSGAGAGAGNGNGMKGKSTSTPVGVKGVQKLDQKIGPKKLGNAQGAGVQKKAPVLATAAAKNRNVGVSAGAGVAKGGGVKKTVG